MDKVLTALVASWAVAAAAWLVSTYRVFKQDKRPMAMWTSLVAMWVLAAAAVTYWVWM